MNVEADQIINEISSIIEKDPELGSFDIIPAIRTKTDEPAVMYAEHNLALKSWSIKDIYSYVHLRLLQKTAEGNYELRLLTVALLLNPHMKTFWNRRRKLVLSGDLDPYSELRYVVLILTYKPKIQDVFTYRKWLLQRIFEKQLQVGNLLIDEMVVIENAASRFNNNHMAWDYAHWLLNFLEQDGIPENTLENIWIRNSSYISIHIADFSALSFRQKLIKKLIHFENRLTATFKYDTIHSCKEYSKRNLPNDLTSQFEFALIVGEMESNENLINFYINHESLWHYRRFLCHVFVRILPQRITQKKLLPDFKSTHSVSHRSYENILFMLNQSFLTNTANNDERYFHNHQKWMCDFCIISNHES